MFWWISPHTLTPTPYPFGEGAKRPNTLFHLSPIHLRPLRPPTPLSAFPASFLLDFSVLLVDIVLFPLHLLLLKALCVTSMPPLLRALPALDTFGI